MTNHHSKFEVPKPKRSLAETENSKFFQHSRKISLSKIIEPQPNSNLYGGA
jgi:hypothetical protein